MACYTVASLSLQRRMKCHRAVFVVALLSSWFEELSHLQFLRQLPPDTQPPPPPPPPPGSSVALHRLPGEPVSHMQDNPQRTNTVGWQNTQLPPQQQHPPSVSIVTTVWEVTNGPGAPQTTIPGQVAQTPTTSVISAQMTAQPQQQLQRMAGATVRYPPLMGDNGQGMYGSLPSPVPRPPVPTQQLHVSESQVANLQNQQPGNPGYGQGHAPAAAAAAAAVAAAAATATATATAHATAQLQEQQERHQAQHGQQTMGGPPQQPYNQQYYPRQYPMQQQQQQPPPHQPMGYSGFNRPSLPPQQRPMQYPQQQPMRQYPPPHNSMYPRPPQSSNFIFPESSQGYVQGQAPVGNQVYVGNTQQGTVMTPDGMNGPGFPSDPNRPLPSQMAAMQYSDRGQQKMVSHRPFQNQYPNQDTSHQMNIQPGYVQSAAPGYPTPLPQSPHFTTKPPPVYPTSQPGHYPGSVPQQVPSQMARRGSLPPYPGAGQSVPGGRIMAQHESVAGTPTHPYMPSYPVPTTDPSGAVRVDLKPNPAALGMGPPDEKPGEMGTKPTGIFLCARFIELWTTEIASNKYSLATKNS